MVKVKTMYCNYDPIDNLYFCSTKTKFGSLEPNLCEFIGNYNGLFEFIKLHQHDYDYSLPFMVANDFEKRLKEKIYD